MYSTGSQRKHRGCSSQITLSIVEYCDPPPKKNATSRGRSQPLPNTWLIGISIDSAVLAGLMSKRQTDTETTEHRLQLGAFSCSACDADCGLITLTMFKSVTSFAETTWFDKWFHVGVIQLLNLIFHYKQWQAIRYDTIRNAILTCNQKLTRASLIYHTEPTIKSGRTDKTKN